MGESRPGPEVVNPEIGSRMRFLRTGPETAGALLESEEWLAPGGSVATRHIHPLQEERFSVHSGELHVELGEEIRVLGPGDACTIAPGVGHRFSNPSESEVHFTGEVRPALRTQELFELLAAIARREGASPAHRLGLLATAPLFFRYRREVAIPGVPLWLQRGALATLATLARTLGRGSIPELPASDRSSGLSAASGSAPPPG